MKLNLLRYQINDNENILKDLVLVSWDGFHFWVLIHKHYTTNTFSNNLDKRDAHI